jgi:hypothetical protein
MSESPSRWLTNAILVPFADQAGWRRVSPKKHNELLDVWREQVNQVRRGQEASWSVAQGLGQESAEAYEDFLESVFFCYGENTRAAENGTREG